MTRKRIYPDGLKRFLPYYWLLRDTLYAVFLRCEAPQMKKVNPILFSSTFILFACFFSEGGYAAAPSGKDQLIENYHKVESY